MRKDYVIVQHYSRSLPANYVVYCRNVTFSTQIAEVGYLPHCELQRLGVFLTLGGFFRT